MTRRNWPNCTPNWRDANLDSPARTGNNKEGNTEKNKERWMELCELAAKESDPDKLLALTNEISRLLGEKNKRQYPGFETDPARLPGALTTDGDPSKLVE